MTLPSVLITDTNIWIDFENGEILAAVFRLPYQFITPDFAIAELISPEWEVLHAFGLQAHALEPDSMLELFRLNQLHKNLSLVDLASMLLAIELRAPLVTGDRHLKSLARTNDLLVYGALWVLDEMVHYRVLLPAQAATTLRHMLDRGARLPVDECNKRFKQWS